MKFSTALCVFSVLLINVYAKKLDPGPEAIKESTPAPTSPSPISKSTPAPPQKNQKRYATREVILYLTPSQIRALQEGKGLVSPQILPEGVHSEHREQAILQQQPELVHHQLDNVKSVNIEHEHTHEKHVELEQPLIKEEVLSVENQQEYDHWRHEQAIREEQARLHHYYHELNKAKLLNIEHGLNLNDEKVVWVPYSPEIQLRQAHRLEEQRHLEEIESHNQYQSKILSPLSILEPRPAKVIQIEKPLSQLQYIPKYNDQKNAILIENILRLRHRHELERQIALAQAEKIANSPPVIVHQDVKVTKHQPVPVEKQVKLAVQEKRVIAEDPISKKLFFNIDKPYFIQEVIPEGIRQAPIEIPVHSSKKVTVLRPVWHH